jgi:hypothetical protein
MPETPPASVADFKAQFQRGFKYAVGPDGVMDSDIELAITLAGALFNPALWSASEKKPVFLMAAAHFVVVNIQASGGLSAKVPGSPGGIADATKNTGGGIITAKTVDKVSITYAGMERWVEKYPMLADFLRTDFGFQYLALLKPRLVGHVVTVENQRAPDSVIPAVPFLS